MASPRGSARASAPLRGPHELEGVFNGCGACCRRVRASKRRVPSAEGWNERGVKTQSRLRRDDDVKGVGVRVAGVANGREV